MSLSDEVALVAQKCQKDEHLRAAWASYQVFWTQNAAQLGWSDYALAFEICVSSLEMSRAVRVHAHASIRSPNKKKCARRTRMLGRGAGRTCLGR